MAGTQKLICMRCLASGVEKIAVLGGRKGSLEWLAKALQGLGSDWAVYVLENLTLEGEKIRLVEAKDLRKITVSSRTIFLVVKNHDKGFKRSSERHMKLNPRTLDPSNPRTLLT